MASGDPRRQAIRGLVHIGLEKAVLGDAEEKPARA